MALLSALKHDRLPTEEPTAELPAAPPGAPASLVLVVVTATLLLGAGAVFGFACLVALLTNPAPVLSGATVPHHYQHGLVLGVRPAEVPDPKSNEGWPYLDASLANSSDPRAYLSPLMGTPTPLDCGPRCSGVQTEDRGVVTLVAVYTVSDVSDDVEDETELTTIVMYPATSHPSVATWVADHLTDARPTEVGRRWYDCLDTFGADRLRCMESLFAYVDVGSEAEQAVRNSIAWGLATHPEPALRDGDHAVTLAKLVVAHSPRAAYLDTLAAALAEAGDFTAAEQAALRATALEPDRQPFADTLAAVHRGEPVRDPTALGGSAE